MSSTSRVAILFSLELAFVAVFAVFFAMGIPSRQLQYRSVPAGIGPFGFFEKQIFQETSPIDILLVGDSKFWTGIDTEVIARRLSAKAGRPLNVQLFGSSWAEEDRSYELLNDVLEHRKVRLVLFSTAYIELMRPGYTSRWIGPEAKGRLFRELSWRDKFRVMGTRFVGIPRLLMAWVDSRVSKEAPEATPVDGMFPEDAPNEVLAQEAFHRYMESAPRHIETRLAHETNVSSYGLSFLKALSELTREKHTRFALLRLPTSRMWDMSFIEVSDCWTRFFPRLAVYGAPDKILFKGFKNEKVNLFFMNTFHLNSTGRSFFSRVLAEQLTKDENWIF